MKRSNLLALVAVAMIITMSSCNRGIGCPSDFSLVDPISQLLNLLF